MKLAVGHVMKVVPRPSKSQCYWTKVDTCLLVLFAVLVVTSVTLGLVFHGKHHYDRLEHGQSSSSSDSESHSRSRSESGSHSEEEPEFGEQRMPRDGYRRAKCTINEMIFTDHLIQCEHTETGEWCDAEILPHPDMERPELSDMDEVENNLPDWINGIQEQIGDQMGENEDLLNQLSGLLGDNMESAQEWVSSLGDGTRDLLAQLMENPTMIDELLGQNPEILEYLLDNDWEMIESLCEQLPQVMERLTTEQGEWAEQFINKLREEHPDIFQRLQTIIPHLFPDDLSIPLDGPTYSEEIDDEWFAPKEDDWDDEYDDDASYEDNNDRSNRRRGHHGGHHGGHHAGHHGPPPASPRGRPPLPPRGSPRGPDMGMPLPWAEEPVGPGRMSPCMLVSVQWTDHHREGHHETVQLHNDVETAQLFPECSFATCESENFEDNRREVEKQMNELREKMLENEEVRCYVHPDYPDVALLQNPGRHKHCMRHAWFWPALAAAVLMALLLIRRCYFSCCKKTLMVEKKVMPERLAPYAVINGDKPVEEEKKPLDGPVVSAYSTTDMAPSNVYVPQTLVAVGAPPAYHALDVTGLLASCPEEKVAPLDVDVSAVHKYMLLHEHASNEANEKKDSLA